MNVSDATRSRMAFPLLRNNTPGCRCWFRVVRSGERDLEAAEDRRASGAGGRMRRRTQQHRKLVGRERASVEPSLCERAAHLQQQALLLSGFDALREGHKTEAVA